MGIVASAVAIGEVIGEAIAGGEIVAEIVEIGESLSEIGEAVGEGFQEVKTYLGFGSEVIELGEEGAELTESLSEALGELGETSELSEAEILEQEAALVESGESGGSVRQMFDSDAEFEAFQNDMVYLKNTGIDKLDVALMIDYVLIA